MASEFLIKKAQEQSQGGQFNSNQSRTGGVKVSSFLTQKAAAQKTTDIPAAVGETVDTGSMTATNGLSADYLSGLLGMVQNLEKSPASAAALKTMGGYYSRPAAATGIENINAQVSGLLPALEKAAAPVSAAMTELQSAEKSLKIAGDYLQRARDEYDSAPTQYNADQYNQIETVYRSAHEKYTEKYGVYSTLLQDYKTAQDQVSQIVGAYQSYVDYQNQQYDSWRGTIRDVSEIQRELDAVQSEIDSRKIQQHYGEDVSARLAVLEQRKTLLLEEYDWSQYFRYADLMNNEDFKAMSKYATTANGKAPVRNNLSGMYTETGFNDLTYDYINRNKEARGKALVNSIGDNTALLGLDKSYLQQMKDDEVATFNYLYATQGADAAYEYVAYLTTTLTQRQRMQDETYWAEYAKAHPVKSSMFSVLTSPMKGLSYLGQHADYWADGKIDQNAAYNKFSYQNSAIRGQVAKQIEESGSWGPVGSFAYQTGMSMADFLLASAISGNNQVITLTVMGSGAAADATMAAKDRGLNDDQAFWLGTIAGVLEGGIEALNMDTVFKPDALKDGVIWYILKNATAEGAEEVATDIGNLVFDVLIAADQNVLQTSIDNYMQQGLTEGEAVARTFTDQALQMMSDFAGGFVSGGILSGTNAGIHVNYTNQMGNHLGELDLDVEDIHAFIETGLESNPETASYQLAVEMQAKIEAGETLSNYDLARLYQANEQAIRAENEADETAPVESADTVGLQLPSLENNNQALNTMKPETAVTLAQRLRQEQNLNGGIHNGSTDGRNAGLDLAQSGDGELRQGTGVLHGSSQRYGGQSAGEQVGGMAGRTGQTAEWRQARTHAGRTAFKRQDLIAHLRTPKLTSKQLGLSNGTDNAKNRIIPEEYWDAGMAAKANQVLQETGKRVVFVTGELEFVNNSGRIGFAKGVITEEQIIVRADSTKFTAEQIADHESYHGMRDRKGQTLNDDIVERIRERFTKEEFDKVLDVYIRELRGVYDLNSAKDGAEYEEMMRAIVEEMIADAHAGMNMWGAGATQFTDTVNRFLEEKGISHEMNQENGAEQPTGPPSERFSYAGENANNADLDALAIAKEMQAAGVADETIRQETGWFVGMDGKWRWEIDDSKMKYSQRGDLGFRERNPGYARYRELLDKANRHVLELSDEAPTEAERAELNRLSEIWRGTFQKPGRITEDALPQDRLADYLQHDELFEAYPQLRKTTLRFADLPDGIRGQYDPSQNSITLDESLRRAPEDTLAHEIQHAIQNAEGFASGSSTRFWDDRQVAKPEYASEIQKAEQAVERAEAAFRKEWADDINLNLVKQYVELDNRLWDEETDPLKQQELADQMEQIEQIAAENGWEDLLNDYYYAVGQLQMAKERAKIHRRTSVDLYHNTAGEIEARDVTARRLHTPEQRRSQAPDRGDENTVFAEDGDDLSLRLGGRFSMDEMEDAETSVRMTESDIRAVQSIGRISVNQFSQADIKATERFARQYWKEMGVKSPFFRAWFGDWRVNDQTPVQVADQQGDARGVQLNEDTQWNIQVSGKVFNETRNHAAKSNRAARPYLSYINDIVKKAILLDSFTMDSGREKSTNSLMMHSMYAVADIGNGPSLIKLYVEEMYDPNQQRTAKRAYQLQNIEVSSLTGDNNTESSGLALASFETADIHTVADLFATVKSRDENLHPRPVSKAVNEDGTPKIYYHGTNAEWTTYDLSKNVNQMWGEGIYLAETEDRARLYGENVMPFYVRALYNNRDARREGVLRDYTLMKNGDLLVYSPEQIKSATNNVGTFDGSNRDIRYSVDDGQAELEEQQKPKKKTQWKKQDVQPVAESKPLRSKRELRNTVLSMFSIPGDKRAELGGMIDAYADRLIKNGSLTEQDRKNFFDRMYESGVMTVPADDFHAEARNYVKKGKIYVSESVRADFGDDWNSFRRQAFGAGVYLTSNRTDAGIDQWNVELADALPGMFDAEDTDLRTILERIIQMAEEGKDEKLSLQEYTARLAGEGYVDENEFLDNMERQLDWALRTFAEKASLEVDLRDRTGKKIAQEREAFAEKTAERSARQKAKEAQRRADEREARKETAKRARDRKELRELQQKTLKQLQWLSKNRNRAPEELQATWDEVLGDIDLYAISAADEMRWSDKHNATWKDLAQMYKDAMKNDPNFLPSKELERIVTRLDATKIADMDLGALQDLYKAAIGLRTEFYNRNNVINDEMQRLFAEVYTDAKREIESAPGGFTGGVADKFLNLDQLTPMNVLQRMAGWDPDGAFYSMAKQLERGERDVRAYSVKAQKMLQDFLTEHEDWVKKADGHGKDAIWYEVEVPQLLELGMGDKPIFGPTVKVYMTPAQKVHMFLESKNLDNLRHMTGGRTFVNKDLYSQGKRQEALSQGRTIKLAPETVRKLVTDLTPEEMELAQILDRYYNTFATQEINKVSNILYGYDKAMGKNYAPIYTNRNYTKTEFGVFDTTAEGVGNLKGRQYAVNPSYNISAFDAFERHVDQTARFCGMAIPARNWTTLMNWREKNNSTGDVITHKWGEESKRYITDLITTLQAGDDAKSDTISSGLSKLQSNYITAIFGANPSIVLKQLGSIPLAGAYLDARNMPTPAQISKIDRSLISKYTQELEWRTMGYATPETKQLKDNPNWTQTNKAFKFVFGGGAITAMDGWAASTLWPWAENKVRREHPELAVGTKAQIDAGESAFYKKVAEEFEIAVSRSQSVSDEIHQGTLRKSKNPITKAFTMFRSDSAQTYNALRQKIGEARYYMRTGAKEKVVQTAKKAAGTAFVAMLLNAAWSEAISFLMALWKNKGKYYRDDEDELTLQSVAGEMVSNMLGSYAGVVTGGEELFELIGNIITGDTWYGIETPGMEQLNDLLDTLIESGSGMRDLVAGGWDVLKNGGNLGDYFSKHSGEMLGGIKDLAKAAAMYLSGMPASNLEAYLTGAMKWISPELGAAYDDLFAETGKSDLAGMEGDALEGRVGRILSDRNVSESDDTAAALAALYEAGYKTAIPSDTPTSVSIDGEKHSLGEYQQQAYDTIWGGIVADALDDMVASDSFKEADPKTQAKMLSNLYTYAAEQAKAELFDEYELDSGASKNADIVAAGATVAECITWNTITSEMKSGEKSAELASWDIPEEAKREIFRCKISDSREDSIAAFDEAGLSFDQFLQAYSMYGLINNEDLKAGMKAVEFSHWANAQGYTAEQAAVVKDELTYFNMTPASSSRYDELVGAGMDPDEAYDLTGALNELQPADGEDEVSDLQKWRASVDFSDDVDDQLAALSAVMTDAQFLKVEIANNFGVNPDAYVTLQEIKSQYDADGNGSYKNAEIQAAVDGLPGYYTTEQKAVLWQLATGSTSARNNPYSRHVGQQVLDARSAAKEKQEDEPELEGLSLGNW